MNVKLPPVAARVAGRPGAPGAEPDYVGAFRRSWSVLVLGTLVAAVTALGISRFAISPTWRSSATVIVNVSGPGGAGAPVLRTFANDQSVGATFETLARQTSVTSLAAAELGVPLGAFLGHAVAHAVPKTPLIQLSYTATSAREAARGAAAYADAFVTTTKQTPGLPGAAVPVSNALVPQSPIGPRTGLNTVVAGLVGLVVAAALVCLRESFAALRHRPGARPEHNGSGRLHTSAPVIVTLGDLDREGVPRARGREG